MIILQLYFYGVLPTHTAYLGVSYNYMQYIIMYVIAQHECNVPYMV